MYTQLSNTLVVHCASLYHRFMFVYSTFSYFEQCTACCISLYELRVTCNHCKTRFTQSHSLKKHRKMNHKMNYELIFNHYKVSPVHSQTWRSIGRVITSSLQDLDMFYHEFKCKNCKIRFAHSHSLKEYKIRHYIISSRLQTCLGQNTSYYEFKYDNCKTGVTHS